MEEVRVATLVSEQIDGKIGHSARKGCVITSWSYNAGLKCLIALDSSYLKHGYGIRMSYRKQGSKVLSASVEII